MLSSLPGLSLFLFSDPGETCPDRVSVMFIAFLAGTIPPCGPPAGSHHRPAQ
ncbi:hypothetical protein QJS66_17325 [Kocuria rhizophila]|nr:hypothetical protein QJS66_17325 [Kocuria rhizophila]